MKEHDISKDVSVLPRTEAFGTDNDDFSAVVTRNPLEQVVPQTKRHLRKSLEDVNVTLHEGRERIVVNSAGFFIRNIKPGDNF